MDGEVDFMIGKEREYLGRSGGSGEEGVSKDVECKRRYM